MYPAPSTVAAGREVDLDAGVVTGQQLVGRHVVELGEAQEAADGQGPLAPLVGAEDRGLELLARASLDVVQGQALLASDGAQTLADQDGMTVHLAVISQPFHRSA